MCVCVHVIGGGDFTNVHNTVYSFVYTCVVSYAVPLSLESREQLLWNLTTMYIQEKNQYIIMYIVIHLY